MSYASWLRGSGVYRPTDPEQAMRRARQFLGLEPHREDAIAIWPTHFERFCVEHDEKLNWLLCPKGHQLTGAEDWIVKDVRTGEVIAKCRENDGTQSWRGPAPR